jgi:hypothetical protein
MARSPSKIKEFYRISTTILRLRLNSPYIFLNQIFFFKILCPQIYGMR